MAICDRTQAKPLTVGPMTLIPGVHDPDGSFHRHLDMMIKLAVTDANAADCVDIRERWEILFIATVFGFGYYIASASGILDESG